MAITSDKGKSKASKKPAKVLDAAGVNAQRLAEVKGTDSPKESERKVENWADKVDSDAYTTASELYEKIQRCYNNKNDQNDKIEEYWNIHSAQPDDNAQYQGNSQCYIPAVRDAIQARVKRSLAQLFPANHKHIEAVGPTGDNPTSQLALLEHYVRKCKLKNIVRADLIAGDVTGQWNLYVDWRKSVRTIHEITKRPPIKENVALGVSLEDSTDEEEQLVDREIIVEGPDIVPLATEDVAIYPPTVDNVEDSIASCVRLRMSKQRVQQMIDEGVFVGVNAKELVDQMGSVDSKREKSDPAKKRTEDAGIKTQGTYKYCLIYEVHTDLKLDGKRKEPAYVYYAGKDLIVGIIKNPRWSGKRPLLSVAIEEITGSFFGISKVEPVKYLQWNLNDFWNMGMDSAQYSLLPIVMTDPLKTPQYNTMVMGLAAIWLADPNSTKFQQFPPLWKDAAQLVQNIKTQIYESSDVNDAMMGKMPPGRKNNQAVGNMQQEQQINITDHAKRYEEMILNPLIEMMFEDDQQFRTDELTVETMGEIGAKAMLKPIEPQQFGQTWFFRWTGTTYQNNMQRTQQMIAMMNVLRGIPPDQLNGRRLDLTPIIDFVVEQTCGPELGGRILIDERNLFTIPPEVENNMLHSGLATPINPGDNHVEHIKSHDEAARMSQDLDGSFRTHIAMHQKALMEQAQKMQGQQQQRQGQPGAPGAGPPGIAGTPRPGAQPGVPRPQGPPGQIHADAMLGAPGRG